MDETEKKRILDKWKWFLITTTPDDPWAGRQRTVQAANQLDALDESAFLNGCAPYTEMVDWQDYMGIDVHGLWAVSGNQTVWAIPINKVPKPTIEQIKYEGLWVTVTRNSTTGQLIVVVNSEGVGWKDKDEDGAGYIEVIVDDATIYDREPRREDAA